MKKLVLLLMACLGIINAQAAYLRNIPVSVTQPDGTVLQCFASGDEFFNYLHDSNGYTIIQHPQTGFYVYAENREGKLVATEYVAGRQDPASKGLQPYALISPQEWQARRRAWEVPDPRPKGRDVIPNHGTLNNIAIFIRFADDPELTNSYASIDNMFNNVSEGAVSMRSYFRAASYGAIEIPTTFYPGHNGDVVVSYQDTYPRSYFQPYNESSNPDGYLEDERAGREFSLLERAVTYINENYPIPAGLNIDYDNDDYVDNVCFIVKGSVGAWSSLLWPHKWALQDRSVYINGKRVWTFNFQLADATSYFNTSTMCHEMNHSLGAPDLYHYYHGTDISPVGRWDLMEENSTPPQHCGAYMKMKYGHWIDEIPEITQAGIYTLNPISSATPTNIAYKIQSMDPNQYYVLEYRDKTSLFEAALPGSGLLIYRIDTRFDGNAGYDPDNGVYDEVYLFRPGGSNSVNGDLSTAHFSSNVGRDEFSHITSAYPFFTDGTVDENFRIYNISSTGNTISFTYGTSSDCEAPTHLTATVQGNNVTLSWDAANNAVSYNIYSHNRLIGNTSATTYLDSDLDYGRYAYSVRSVDANGLVSAASETVIATIIPEGAVFIGDGNSNTDDNLPSHSYYKYGLSQQIYTAEELGEAGVITKIAFYNGGPERTRTYDFFLKNTEKTSFSSKTDWITVTAADKVFSGSVTMAANAWTVINFSSPFAYNGSSNVVLVAEDNTGSYAYAPYMSCRVFDAPRQALYAYLDNDIFNALVPPTTSSAHNEVLSVKTQLIVSKTTPTTGPFNITVSSSPAQGGSVSGGGSYNFGETCTVTATVNEGYHFCGWFENGEMITMETEFSFTVVQERNLVATFQQGLFIGEGTTTSDYLPSYSFYNHSLTQQIYTADEIGYACTINSIAFYNDGSTKTRTYDMYLVHTDKTAFSGNKDWITVTAADKVFSGSVEMVKGNWTVFTLDTPFEYDGTSNLALIMDDNTGSYSSGLACRVFNAEGNQAIRVYSDGTNYDPTNPSAYTGTTMNVKNQLKMEVAVGGQAVQTITLTEGWNWLSLYVEGDPVAMLNALKVGLDGKALQIQGKNEVTEFDGEDWFGDMDEVGLANNQTYMIEIANGTAPFQIELTGTPATISDYTITIAPGWNWIGFPSAIAVDVADAMEGFNAEAGDVIQSKNGMTEFDGEDWFGDLDRFEPGEGFMYFSNSSETKTLTF